MDHSLELHSGKCWPARRLPWLTIAWIVAVLLSFSLVSRAGPSTAAGGAGEASASGQEAGAAQGGAGTREASGGDDTRDEAADSDTSVYGAPPPGEPGAARTLPPVEPHPAVAPVFEREGEEEQPKASAVSKSERPGIVIKTLVGLLILLVLAYLGGHARALRWEQQLGISQVITAGFPFILLGMIARQPSVGILTDSVLRELSPILRIGLGSIGLIAGFRFDTRLFQKVPSGTATVALLSTVVPAAAVVGVVAPVLLVFSNDLSTGSLRDPVFLRDALILAAAGAMTARSALKRPDLGVAAHVIRLEAITGVAGVAAVAAFFRPQAAGVTWQLPGMGWLLITIGLGTALGLLFYAILQAARGTTDFLVVTLGSLSFAAGAAGYLSLSSVAVAFVAGVMLVNFPGTYHERLRDLLRRIERPIYLLSLFVIGALWQVDDWRGWALMPLFMAARLAGKWLASVAVIRHSGLPVTPREGRLLAVSPIGALAVAIVVNAQLLYPGGSISLIVSAVVGGGVLTEIFVQLANRTWLRGQARAETASAPDDNQHPRERAP
jgi:hypothetical protein